MARRKRVSPALKKATQRVASMRSIPETLDFGNGVSLEMYEQQMNRFQQTLLNYNTLLSTVDESTRQVAEQEKALSELTEAMLINIAARYGRDSSQYVQAGGKTRKKGNKRSTPSAPAIESSEASKSAMTPLQATFN